MTTDTAATRFYELIRRGNEIASHGTTSEFVVILDEIRELIKTRTDLVIAGQGVFTEMLKRYYENENCRN